MAAAGVQNLIQEPRASVYAAVGHNVISPFESMTLFSFFFKGLMAFSGADGNATPGGPVLGVLVGDSRVYRVDRLTEASRLLLRS